MFTEEDKKRYLNTQNILFKALKEVKLDPLKDKIQYNILYVGQRALKKETDNIATVIQFMYDNHLSLISLTNLGGAFSPFILGPFHTVNITCCLSIDDEITASVYSLLKDFTNKKTLQFKEQLDNAILNGHITFKQYNELCREVQ